MVLLRLSIERVGIDIINYVTHAHVYNIYMYSMGLKLSGYYYFFISTYVCTYLVALVDLLFSWFFSRFHHCPWPSTLPALFSTRPRTTWGSCEMRGVTNHTLGLEGWNVYGDYEFSTTLDINSGIRLLHTSQYFYTWLLVKLYTVKRHFYAREKFMQICQNGPLDKFMRFLFMYSSALCIVTYGAIKIYVV